MNYKEIIESRYNREAWQGLLHDIFHNNVKFWSNPIPSATVLPKRLYASAT